MLLGSWENGKGYVAKGCLRVFESVIVFKRESSGFLRHPFATSPFPFSQGSYVCGRTAGEFVWQPGIVTQSLLQGRWLVLEDADRLQFFLTTSIYYKHMHHLHKYVLQIYASYALLQTTS